MRKFIHIRSKIPAIISINGDKTPYNNLDIMCTSDFYVAFFPITQEKYLPCAISTNGFNNPSSIKKIPYKDQHYEILYNPTPIPTSEHEYCLLNKKYNNFTINITNSNQTYINISSANFQHSSTTEKIEGITFKSFDGIFILTGRNKSNLQYLLIFNTKNKKVVIENLFNTIEIKKTELKALKKDKIDSNYGKVYTFNFESKKISNYSIYLKPPIHSSQPEIIPFQFLKSLQYGDYKQCLSMLNNLDASPEKLKLYFGDIDEIYLNGYSDEINYTIFGNNKYRNFTFHVENSKIINIEENPL